jgi:hypothetical protein
VPFRFPNRYGTMDAEMKAFFGSTGGSPRSPEASSSAYHHRHLGTPRRPLRKHSLPLLQWWIK